MTAIDRWYIKEAFTEVSYQSVLNVWLNASETDKNIDFGSDAWLIDPKSPGAAGKPPVYFQVIIRRPIAEIKALLNNDKFDLASFQNETLVNALKTEAAIIVSNNLTSLENKIEEDPAGYLTVLKQNAYVPYNFYIDPGAESAGSLISFQVLFSYRDKPEKETQAAAEAAAGPPAPTPAVPPTTPDGAVDVKLVEYNAYKFMHWGYSNGQDTLSLVEKALEKAHEANSFDNLEEKYDISFASLNSEMKSLHDLLAKKYFGVTSDARTGEYGDLGKGAHGSGIAEDAPTVDGRLKHAWERGTGDISFGSHEMFRKREVIEFGFTFPGEIPGTTMLGQTIADHLGVGASLVPSAPDDRVTKIARISGYIKPESPLQEKEEELPGVSEYFDPSDPDDPDEFWSGFFWENSGVIVMSPVGINEDLSDQIRFLLYKADEIRSFLAAGFDLESFVLQFIRPTPQKLPRPKEATKVYNKREGDPPYKSSTVLQGEILSDKQKSEIHKSVLQKYNQVGDAAFLNILKNNKTIESIEDVYKKVLNVIPLNSIIQAAASCLLKYLPNTNLKELVCDTVLGEINFEDLDGFVAMMQKHASSPEVSAVLDTIIDPTAVVSGAIGDKSPSVMSAEKNALKARLQDKFKNDFVAKDIICEMIFKAIPSAKDLLKNLQAGSMKDLSKNLPFSKKDIPNIENPAKPIFDSMEKTIGQYKGMALTGDWAIMIKEAILDFVKELIAQLVSKILEEIAFLCEGSSKADFANMNTETAARADGTSIPEYADAPVFPFNPATINDAITDPAVYPELASFVGVPTSLIRDFIDALGKLLTLSEICALLDEDSSDVNVTYLINKIWNSILSLEKFAPLKTALGNKGKLRQFFYILSTKTSKKYCIDKLNGLENTKKLLSNLCGPPSNNALIEDLKNKASDDAIKKLLEQENDIAKSLLDAMHKIKNVDVPPMFCGPDANSAKDPIFPNHQHPSVEYLNKNFMRKILMGIQAAFEKDVGFYKPILTMGGTNGPFTKFIEASNEVAGTMSKTYGIKLQYKDGTPIDETTEGGLNQVMAQGKIIAPAVYSALTQANVGIGVSANTSLEFLRIFGAPSSGDTLSLNINFGDTTGTGVHNTSPHSSKLWFGQAKSIEHPINSDENPGGVINTIINTYNDQNNYDIFIKNLTGDLPFYAEVFDQMIKEHAEYITTQGLFKKSVFDTLNLSKKDPCDKSLFDFKPIFDAIPENIKLLQCRIPMSAIPTVQEICQINAFVELAVKVVIIKEFLRSLMVFSVFGINSLLSDNNDSFYYKYLEDQISNKLDVGGKLTKLIEKFSLPIYAAKEKKAIEEVSVNDVKIDIISRNTDSVQSMLYEKNKHILDNSALAILKSEFEAAGSTLDKYKLIIPRQVLKNIIDSPNASSAGAGPLILDPPEVVGVSVDNKQIIIESGFYSQHPRLTNGGFFIEQGFDVSHKFEGDSSVFTTADWDDMIEGMSADQSSYLWDKVLLYPLGRGILAMLFGSGIPNQNDPAYTKTLASLTASNIKRLSNTEGKISLKAYDAAYSQLFARVADKYGNKVHVLETLLLALGIKSNFVDDLIGNFPTNNKPNKFFKKYNFYKSLNILIPVTSNIMIPKWTTLKEYSGPPQYTAGFFESVLDKKYFIQEEGGTLYFKLPLLIFYDRENSTVSPADTVSNGELFFLPPGSTPAGTNDGTVGSPVRAAADFRPGLNTSNVNHIYTAISTDSGFKDFVDAIQYKDMLSFLAILIAEMIEKQYPALQPMFDGTLNAIYTALDTFLTTANRDKDPEFYQKTHFSTEDAVNGGMDMNWVMMILEMLLKTLASATDPTWKTPWFFPGPLTPIGIIAKILDSGMLEKDKSNAMEDAAGALKTDAIKCPEESNS